jgi:hypothetical protein
MILLHQHYQQVVHLITLNYAVNLVEVGQLVVHVAVLVKLLVCDFLLELESLVYCHVFRVEGEQLSSLFL